MKNGAYTAATDGVGKAWIADLLPADRVGSGLGIYQGIAGGPPLVAGVWAGLAYTNACLTSIRGRGWNDIHADL